MSSFRCGVEAFWDSSSCVPCQKRNKIKKGHEFNPHCGRSDDGGYNLPLYKSCLNGTFNDGSYLKCQPCRTCPPDKLLSPCTNTSDARCCENERECGGFTTERSTSVESVTLALTTGPTTDQTTEHKTDEASASPQLNLNHSNILVGLGAVIIVVLIFVCLIYLLYTIKKWKHRSYKGKKWINGRSNVSIEDANTCLTYEPRQDNAEEPLNINFLLTPEIQAASLQTVLNNLDVVEELVFLLDPDTPGMKSTRHLAASCSIPFTWINYAYSMRDSKSPLIAVLERLMASHPHWNVGHFAGLLSNIGRNDAVLVLGKLTLTPEDV
ncbi:IGF-like family receptor 1 [Brachyhypopomus gauderio]|uniref:IGF-like family receptor 1 n=1 Tax=Brachyhypopomus gauderio TaxID=698409 RepID=UPI004043384F